MDNQSFAGVQRFDGKVVLVTGAAGILGRRFCAGFAELGASIAAVDIDAQGAEQIASELHRSYGTPTVGMGCDVSDPVLVSSMVKEVVLALGGIHVLHNNAATKGRDIRAFFANFEDYRLETWREVMAVNIDAMFLVAQAVGRQMIAQRQGGAIVQTSSIYGAVAPDPRIYEGSQYLGGPINTPAVYAVSKAAVIGLTRFLATHWAEKNIRVNCLLPGGVESGQNEEFKRRYAARVPLGRMAHVDEIVGAGLFLASDAASYVTGQCLVVDGGLTVW